MKQEFEALRFLLWFTERSTESFIKLALTDDLEHERKHNSNFDENAYGYSLSQKERSQHLRQCIQTRRREITIHFFYAAFSIVAFIFTAPFIGLEITIKWILGLFGLVLVIFSHAFEIKSSEKTFDGDDIFERALSLGKDILFWTGIFITGVSLLIPD